MGYLNNTVVTVDAILTDVGRQLLAQQNGQFQITQFAKRWGWYQSIYAIAQGDITRFDEVTNYKLTKCLTYLVFEKQKTDIERRGKKFTFITG